MTSKDAVKKERILEYLDNIQRQMEDIGSISVSGHLFFLERKNAIKIKAIKYSLACAIQDVTRICAHIASALSLWKVRESESEAILGLADADILPKEFAEKIIGMPAFRNRIIHDYLPNEFDAFNPVKHARRGSRHITPRAFPPVPPSIFLFPHEKSG